MSQPYDERKTEVEDVVEMGGESACWAGLLDEEGRLLTEDERRAASSGNDVSGPDDRQPEGKAESSR